MGSILNSIGVILTIFILSGSLFAQSKKIKADKFSDYQGAMNWEDAKKKCGALGMRLPSIEELQTAYDSKALDTWGTDNFNVYWSSTPEGKTDAKIIRVDYGNVITDNKNARYNVRCFKEGSSKTSDSGKITKLGNFGSYQGAMSWEDAKAKCKKLGMRLPSIEDLKSAFNDKTTEPWKDDANTYWSSTYNTEGNADTLGIYNNDASNMRVDYNAHVRCIK